MTARRSRLRGIPPNRATSSGLPARRFRASKQVRIPSLVSILALWRAAIVVTDFEETFVVFRGGGQVAADRAELLGAGEGA